MSKHIRDYLDEQHGGTDKLSFSKKILDNVFSKSMMSDETATKNFVILFGQPALGESLIRKIAYKLLHLKPTNSDQTNTILDSINKSYINIELDHLIYSFFKNGKQRLIEKLKDHLTKIKSFESDNHEDFEKAYFLLKEINDPKEKDLDKFKTKLKELNGLYNVASNKQTLIDGQTSTDLLKENIHIKHLNYDVIAELNRINDSFDTSKPYLFYGPTDKNMSPQNVAESIQTFKELYKQISDEYFNIRNKITTICDVMLYVATYLGLNIFFEINCRDYAYVDRIIKEYSDYHKYNICVIYPYINNVLDSNKEHASKLLNRVVSEDKCPVILEHLNTKKQLSNTKKSDTIDIKNNNKSKISFIKYDSSNLELLNNDILFR